MCTVAAVGVHRRRFHGRPRTAALAAFSGGGERRSRACIPAGRPAVREPSRDKGGRDGAGDRRQALPATGSPEPTAGSQDHGDIRAVSVQGDVGEWLPAASAPP